MRANNITAYSNSKENTLSTNSKKNPGHLVTSGKSRGLPPKIGFVILEVGFSTDWGAKQATKPSRLKKRLR